MMSGLSNAMKRRPLVAFFVLTYALSWLAWPLWASGLYPIAPVFSFAPFLAALIVLAVTLGKGGVGGLLRRMVRWRVGIRWYAVALLLPAGITVAAVVLNVLLGARGPSAADLGGWTALLPGFAVALLIPGLGGAWEEPGWRGFALPRLQSGRSALFAALILGVLVAGWHLPMMVVGDVHWSDTVSIMGAVIVFNWVFNNANGSVLIIMIMHATNNAVSGQFFSPMFSGADSVTQGWLLAALWCTVAIVVVVVAGLAHLSRKHDKQEEGKEEAAEPGVATPPGAAKPTPARTR
jgi:CAAX protease family protein